MYTGIGQFVSQFAEPGDPEYAPPVQKGETAVRFSASTLAPVTFLVSLENLVPCRFGFSLAFHSWLLLELAIIWYELRNDIFSL